ncbi:hypothetical protein CDD80_5545 [Ophiocordyceps camponoti-rufipedis]|uniref:Uncharacterized protein n=1 Tax=Ophiocordyceps camponoti-rufipedis TaxID=2004952 RepID=A0A2C5YU56_9HYPO|nr:hypothetical protein CDD80_5545 [Ophiocordyceps camponoti-rufipedis]
MNPPKATPEESRRREDSQQRQLQIPVNLGLERNLDLEVKIQPQPQRITLPTAAATTALTVDGLVGDGAERAGDGADGVVGQVVDGEAV